MLKGEIKTSFSGKDDLCIRTSVSSSNGKARDVDKGISKSLQNLRELSPENVPRDDEQAFEKLIEPSLTPASRTNHDRTLKGATLSSSGKDENGKSVKIPGKDSEETKNEAVIYYQDEAVSIDETGGGNSIKTEAPPRLLIISSKIRNSSAMRNAILPNVIVIQYKYESTTLEALTGLITSTLSNRMIQSIAVILSCTGAAIQLTGKDEKVITKDTISDSQPIREFFTSLVRDHKDKTCEEFRLDFLACHAVLHGDMSSVAKDLESLIQVPVTMSRDIMGTDSSQLKGNNEAANSKLVNVGELYFKLDKVKGFSGQQQTLAGFEKIQTVGKGAYGAAVLYKKKDDESLVILKEINMHDLNASERQLALNEVSILAMLDHPNIISYYDNFEDDGVLMIEIEYADGGTLAQFLNQQEKSLEEKAILCMFKQIVAAIRHIHEHNVLHRDLKTANIFLTKEGVIKVGDFGISKMMSSTNKGANTVLGTPYYISPEMCEGKPYNDKSDIWALGCILYEMACLQKTFEGSNLPALVNKIMKGQFAPVKGNYSQDFKDLIMNMLKQDPDQRPSANELLYTRLPELMNKFEDPATDYEDDVTTQNVGDSKNKKKTRSVFFYFVSSTATMTPIELPPKIKIRCASAGEDHVIVVTTERQVFSWGKGSKGQLGHGNTENISKPTLVEALTGKSISRACCGDGFSVFASDNGIILTCGDGVNGCLGHGDWCPTYRPRLIEPLLSTDVISVACGPQHVVVVGSAGEIFAWGKGADGRLGLGNEEDKCQPTEVNIVEPDVIREVRCGVDGTMFLTDVGSVFACGSNLDNKLGLNHRQGFIMAMKNLFIKTEVEGMKIPTPVRALSRHKVLDISLGAHHTAVMVEPGHVYTFGRNTGGELGIGNTKENSAPVEVKLMAGSIINRVQCGEHYTVSSTVNNELYYWGLRFRSSSTTSNQEDNDSKSSTNGSMNNKDDLRLESITPRKASEGGHSRQASIGSVTSICSTKDSLPTQDSAVASTLGSGVTDDSSHDVNKPSPSHKRQKSVDSMFSDSGLASSNTQSDISANTHSGFRPLSSVPRKTPSASSNSRDTSKEKEQEPAKEESEIIFPPMHLMRILKSGDEALTISSFFCHGENLFVQLETTAPPPRRKTRKKRGFRKRYSENKLTLPPETILYSSREAGDEYSSEASEMDSQGTVPHWLKQELAVSETEMNDGNEADDTSDQSDSEPTRPLIESSMSSIQINKDLTPAKTSEKKTSPGVIQKQLTANQNTKKNFSKTDYKRVTNRSLSTNSTESEVDLQSGGFHSDGSSKDHSHRGHTRTPSDSSAVIKKNLQPGGVNSRKMSAPPGGRSRLPPGPVGQKMTSARIQARGPRNEVKEKVAARGFVSDVTVKRRQEALLHELDLTRQEKKRAEEEIQELAAKYHKKEEYFRKEAEEKVLQREKNLEDQIELLRQELQSQNSKLQDNQKMVMSLQEELVKVKTKSVRGQSASTGGKESKVCTIQ